MLHKVLVLQPELWCCAAVGEDVVWFCWSVGLGASAERPAGLDPASCATTAEQVEGLQRGE